MDWFYIVLFIAVSLTCIHPAGNNIFIFLKRAERWSWIVLFVMLAVSVFTLRYTDFYEFMQKYYLLYSGSWIVFLLSASILMIVSVVPTMRTNLTLRRYYELYDYRNQGIRTNRGMFMGLCCLSLISYCGYAAGLSGVCEWIIYMIAPMDHLRYLGWEYSSPHLNWAALLIGLASSIIYRVMSEQFRNRYTTV
ncbi:TPA: hypothetical protein QHW61_004708 [Klebsiella oxytoca]|nr:hypothetical protein [Klebsiella oxytoca]